MGRSREDIQNARKIIGEGKGDRARHDGCGAGHDAKIQQTNQMG
jgi:hypothetical protein